MNESPRTPAPDFEEQLNALAEEMSNGLGRQAAIDRLIELGLPEDEADDQEAAIREQLRAIHRGARAIFRDLDDGLERAQAVLRFQELGMTRKDAILAIDSYTDRKCSLHGEAQEILKGINRGLTRAEAMARFRELGLHEPTMRHLVGMRFDVNAHWGREFLWLGLVTAGLGVLLVLGVLSGGPQPVSAYLLPATMLVYGVVFGYCGWRRQRQYSDPGRGTEPDPFELARTGHGRTRAVVRAVELGVVPAEAGVLIHTHLDGVVRIYRWLVVFGLLALGWAAYLLVRCLFGEALHSGQWLSVLALALWGLLGTTRGGLGWRRFSTP